MCRKFPVRVQDLVGSPFELADVIWHEADEAQTMQVFVDWVECLPVLPLDLVKKWPPDEPGDVDLRTEFL